MYDVKIVKENKYIGHTNCLSTAFRISERYLCEHGLYDRLIRIISTATGNVFQTDFSDIKMAVKERLIAELNNTTDLTEIVLKQISDETIAAIFLEIMKTER